MGPDQIHGVVRWISILCATKPPNLTLFGNMIIISQIAIEKNLKKFLSPHLKKPGSKKSAVKLPKMLLGANGRKWAQNGRKISLLRKLCSKLVANLAKIS